VIRSSSEAIVNVAMFGCPFRSSFYTLCSRHQTVYQSTIKVRSPEDQDRVKIHWAPTLPVEWVVYAGLIKGMSGTN